MNSDRKGILKVLQPALSAGYRIRTSAPARCRPAQHGLAAIFFLVMILGNHAPCFAARSGAADSRPPMESSYPIPEAASNDTSCIQSSQQSRITDIQVDGAFPLSERSIIGIITLRTGAVLEPDAIPEQRSRLITYLKQQGFIRPSVTIQPLPDADGMNSRIQISLHKGNFQHLAQIRFRGVRIFSAFRLKALMTTWRQSLLPGVSGRLIESDIQKDIHKLSSLYWRHGYLDARIHYKLTPIPGKPFDVNMDITVMENVHYRFIWSGNQHISTSALTTDLVFSSEGKINDTGISLSIHKIKARYNNAGYTNPQVTITEGDATGTSHPNEKPVYIHIQEGPKTQIDRITIHGNHDLPIGSIEGQILSRSRGIFNSGVWAPETLREDTQAITALYFSKGYRSAEVTPDIVFSPDHTKAAITINIHEHAQTRISNIAISGLHSISRQNALKSLSLKTGAPFDENSLKNDKNTLSDMVSDTGHPYVQIQDRVVYSDHPSRAEIEYIVDEGPFVTMGDITLAGNFVTQKRVLKNEMEISTGDPFSLKKVLKSQKNIRSMEIIHSVQFHACGLKEKAHRINLVIEVEEAKPYVLDAGIGYETQKGAFAHTRFEDRNLWGDNIKSWAQTEVSQIGYKVETGLTEPRFLETRVSADASIYSEDRSEFNQGFGIRIMGSSLSFSRNWQNHFSTGLSLGAEQRKLYENPKSTVQTYWADNLSPNSVDPRSLMVLSPKLQYDTRDSFVRPTKGIFAAGYMDASNGMDSNLDDFIRYRLDIRTYITPLPRLTLACAARWGYMEPMNAQRIVATDQLFYLGGSANVRGFDENMLRYDSTHTPVGGLSSTSGTLEGRIDLGHDLELDLFVDTGALSRYQAPNIEEGFRTSAGFGLRYITPIGPIGLVYGFKLNPEPGEAPGRLHFSIGYSF